MCYLILKPLRNFYLPRGILHFMQSTLLSLVLLLFGLSSVNSQTLKESLELAYQNSNLLKTSMVQEIIQNEAIFQRNINNRPPVSFSAGTDLSNRSNPNNSTHTGSLQLSSQYNLYDFGSNALGTEIAELQLQSLRLNREGIVQSIFLNTLQSFYQILRQQNLLELERNSLQALEARLEASRERFELGALTKTQLSLVEAQVAAAKGSIKSREGQLNIARESYFFAVGEYPNNLIAPQQLPEIPTNIDTAKELASTMNPSILQAKLAVLIAEKNLSKGITDAFKPPIKLQGSLSSNVDLRHQNSTRKNSYSIGLQYTIPILTWGKGKSGERALNAEIQSNRINLRQQALIVENQIINSWNQLYIAESLIDVLTEERDYSQLVLEGTIAEESLGAKTTLDVIDAEKDLLESNTNVIGALFDRDLAKYNLLYAIGLLTSEHLGLNLTP